MSSVQGETGWRHVQEQSAGGAGQENLPPGGGGEQETRRGESSPEKDQTSLSWSQQTLQDGIRGKSR